MTNHPDSARRTGPALEAMHRFILWLVPTVEKFPRSQKFLLGDRIQTAALDVLERLIEASYSQQREATLAQAVRRFRNRLRSLRDRWRAATVTEAKAAQRAGAWIAHAEHVDTWRLQRAMFRGGWCDPSNQLP